MLLEDNLVHRDNLEQSRTQIEAQKDEMVELGRGLQASIKKEQEAQTAQIALKDEVERLECERTDLIAQLQESEKVLL